MRTAGELRVYPDAHSLAREAAAHIVALAKTSVMARGQFTLALSGGSTPRLTYALLGMQSADQVDWPQVQIFWSDERCVPPDSSESNYRMAYEALLAHLPLPPENIHRMQGELPPEAAARAYEADLRTIFGRDRTPRFDLILLGLGEDGHTASLFPGTPVVQESARWVVAHYIERLASWRITFTPVLLNAAASVVFLVTGSRKAERLQQVRQGIYQPDRLPAQIVAPQDGSLHWFVDAQAAMV